MKSTELAKALAPFAQLANRHALSPAYRSLQLDGEGVRGCSAYAMLEVGVALPFPSALDAPIHVDADSFLAVLKSLPNEDLTLSADGGVLVWTCGAAKGKLALATIKDYPLIDTTKIDNDAEGWEPTDEFYRALELGALSCTNVALTSAGMYGVVIDTRSDQVGVFSSDNVSISGAWAAGSWISGAPERMTFTPDAIDLLRTCIAYGEEVAKLYFDVTGVTIISGNLMAVIKQVPALKHDFRSMLQAFPDNEILVPIPPERIAAFIKRATALTEAKRSASVSISASEGHLSLAFEEGVSSSEEYYLIEDVRVPDISSIQIDAMRLARVLSQVEYIILDYVERAALVFGGEKNDVPFSYLLSGRLTK